GLLQRTADYRYVDMHASGSAGFHEWLHLQTLERVADDQRGFANVIEGCTRAGVQIEMNVVRTIDVIAARVPLIQVDASEIDYPEQRWHVVDDRKVNDIAGTVRDRTRANPFRTRDGGALHEEGVTRRAIRIAFHDHRPVAYVRYQHRRQIRVVLDQKTFG